VIKNRQKSFLNEEKIFLFAVMPQYFIE